MNIKSAKFFCAVVFVLSSIGSCFAETIETKYFTVLLCDGCNIADFAQRVSLGSSIRFDTYSESQSTIKQILKTDIDDLFLEACDVLDIHLSSYHGRINVYPDSVGVSEIVFSSASIIENSLPSIFVPSQNTIHISLKDLTAGMLAHEMAHAVISNYFVVAPPPKVQEILAGYVEYAIRKKTGSLPHRR